MAEKVKELRPTIEAGKVYKVLDVAAHFGCQVRTMQQWLQRAGVRCDGPTAATRLVSGDAVLRALSGSPLEDEG